MSELTLISVHLFVCPPFQAWESDEAIEEDMPESPGAEKQDKEKDHRDSKKNRGRTHQDC